MQIVIVIKMIDTNIYSLSGFLFNDIDSTVRLGAIQNFKNCGNTRVC